MSSIGMGEEYWEDNDSIHICNFKFKHCSSIICWIFYWNTIIIWIQGKIGWWTFLILLAFFPVIRITQTSKQIKSFPNLSALEFDKNLSPLQSCNIYKFLVMILNFKNFCFIPTLHLFLTLSKIVSILFYLHLKNSHKLHWLH